jgi:hypothetical protein
MPDPRALAGQPGSALGAAPVDDSSTLLGGHAFEKAVVSGPLDSAGLKCSFHGKNSLPVLDCLILFSLLRLNSSLPVPPENVTGADTPNRGSKAQDDHSVKNKCPR